MYTIVKSETGPSMTKTKILSLSVLTATLTKRASTSKHNLNKYLFTDEELKGHIQRVIHAFETIVAARIPWNMLGPLIQSKTFTLTDFQEELRRRLTGTDFEAVRGAFEFEIELEEDLLTELWIYIAQLVNSPPALEEKTAPTAREGRAVFLPQKTFVNSH